jgi:hypothetical protein
MSLLVALTVTLVHCEFTDAQHTFLGLKLFLGLLFFLSLAPSWYLVLKTFFVIDSIKKIKRCRLCFTGLINVIILSLTLYFIVSHLVDHCIIENTLVPRGVFLFSHVGFISIVKLMFVIFCVKF